MKKHLLLSSGIALSILLFSQNCELAPSTNTLSTPTPIPADAWKMPVDVKSDASRQDWLQFGWASFIALNWPADNNWPKSGDGGKPNRDMHITDKAAAKRPTVWQTYLAPGQLFLEKGAHPGTWDQPVEEFTTKSNGQKLLPVLGGFAEKGLYFLNQNPVVGLALYDLATTPNPVIDQNKNYVLLEVRLNQSEFEYFTQTGYYDACKQSAVLAAAPADFQYLPQTGNKNLPEWAQQGAVEIKASWKILEADTDITHRYFTTEGYYLSPSHDTLGPYTLGLVGLHILRNTPNSAKTWYWATFEQIDNVKIYDQEVPIRPDGQPLAPSFNPGPAGAEPQYAIGFDSTGRMDLANLHNLNPPVYGNPVVKPVMLEAGKAMPPRAERTPVDCSRVTAIPDDVQEMNKAYQAQLAGTPWQYYEMINAIYPDPNGEWELHQPNNQPLDPPVYVNDSALVNTTMETYLAYKLSDWKLDNCLSCHYDAKPRAFKDSTTNIQTFSYLYRRALPSVTIDTFDCALSYLR
ncbi:MAG: hypothetical protein AAFP19_12505, partial [Bacteroidota bacterium]